MSESFLNGRVTLHPGDCLDVLARLEENSIDSVCCDPPYHLTSIVKRFGAEGSAPAKSFGVSKMHNNSFVNPNALQYTRLSKGFMGKVWDGGDVAFRPETWAAVYRVLKPGGFLVAFGGTRTFHRMACAIEDAEFEVRDTLSFLYGSGFPKSHDVSKGIDRAAGAARDIVGEDKFAARRPNGRAGNEVYGADNRTDWTITAPATDAAREWAGWGSALKPAVEPIIIAQKKLNAVPSYATLAATTISIEALLTWLISPAKFAESISRLSHQGRIEDAVSVRLLAALNNMLLSGEASAVTAMFKSPEAAKISLSIGLLWNVILAAIWPNTNTFTTATATALTTGLQTLNCWLLATIPDSIMQVVSVADGVWFDVVNVDGNSNDSSQLSNIIRARSAAEPASIAIIQKILFTLADLAADSLPQHQAIIENFVRQPVQTVSTMHGDANANAANAPIVAPFLKLSPHAIRDIVDESAWQRHTENNFTPNLELIVLARKPLSEGTIAANVLRWGTGAINVDGCRVVSGESTVRHNHGGTGNPEQWRTGNGSDYTAGSDNGRWPANVVLEDSDEVVAGFPDAPGQGGSVSGGEPSSLIANVYGERARKPSENPRNDSGSAARYFYTAKADAMDRVGSRHPTIKPLDLMQWLVRLVTPPKGLCLDPFAGTGTTGEAAWREGMRAVLIEAEPEYCNDIRRRMALALSGPDERSRESIKAKNLPRDDGPLFALPEAAE